MQKLFVDRYIRKEFTQMYNRNCPKCGKPISYKSKYNKNRADELNKNCSSCVSKEQHGDPSRKKKVNKNNDVFKTATYKNSVKHLGKNNGMFGTSVYSIWLHKYGKEEADKRRSNTNKKHSFNNSGSKNSMFGKPSPQGSGNGWSGWYKGIYFRSLLELSFLYELISTNTTYINGECSKYEIPYTVDGIERNYYPDFIVGNKMYEVKPKRLWKSKNVLFKKEAAEKWCIANKMEYVLLEPAKLNKESIKRLIEEKSLKILDRYVKRVNEYLKK